MAVRQYIGARYVPLYVGDWDSTRNYEPLSIVTDGNGNSYTSLKDVPAGTSLNNRDYWIITASFSGAVEVLRRDLNQAQDDITTLQSDVSGVQGDVTTLQGDLSGVQGDVTTLQGDINTLQSGLSDVTDDVSDLESVLQGYQKPFEKSKILIVTDSYGIVAGSIAEQITAAGFDCEQVAQGGRGFATSVNFTSCLESYEGDRNAIDYIVVVGGANDFDFTTQQIYSGMSQFANYARSQFPNAKICVGHFGVRMAAPMGDISIQAYILGCAIYNFRYIPNSQYVLRDTAFLADDLLHPTAGGVTQIVNQLITFFNTGRCDVFYIISSPYTGASNFNNGRMKMTRRNGIVRITPVLVNEAILSYNNGNDYGSAGNKTIATLDRSLVNCNAGDYFQIYFTASTSGVSGTQYPAVMNARITNKLLQASLVSGLTPTNLYLASYSITIFD